MNRGAALPIIAVSDLHRSYQLGNGTVYALRGVSLEVAQTGNVIALMGPSGSGKSTLLNIIGALDKPNSGSVKIQGTELGQLGSVDQAEFRNHAVGFIFQNFNLIPVLTALENVVLPAQLSRDPGARAKAAIS